MADPVLTISVPGEAISKSNATVARFNWKTKKSEVFIPEKYQDYEQVVKAAAIEYMTQTKQKAYLTGPVQIRIIYYLGSKRRKDLLNLPKTTCDALNGVFYDDDCQIVQAYCEKRYDKENPRVEITVARPSTKLVSWSLPTKYAAPTKKRTPKKRAKKPATKSKSTGT